MSFIGNGVNLSNDFNHQFINQPNHSENAFQTLAVVVEAEIALSDALFEHVFDTAFNIYPDGQVYPGVAWMVCEPGREQMCAVTETV